MTDGTDNNGGTQSKKSNVIEFVCPEKISYDVEELTEFLGAIFRNLNADDNILAWEVTPGSHPKYPKSEKTLLGILERRTHPKGLYFGTATCKRHEDGNLYNRKDLFTGLFAVVLDDINSKVDINKFKDITPSYIIESSHMNYQYGFILKEPIRDLDHATAFIKAIYNSGFSDEGGAMPTKLVRLPGGVNGKKGPKQGFPVRLVEMNPDILWRYDDLLDALNVPHTYEELCNDPDLFKSSRTAGTTPWTAPNAVSESAKGVVDPVLEQLYADNLVHQDNGRWVDILCPWHESHTTGEPFAGYKPIGRGDNPHERGFHCFHEHCKDNKTNEFLEHIAKEYGFEVSRIDYAAGLLKDYVFDEGANGVWNLRTPDDPQFMKLGAFRESFCQPCRIHKPDGKTATIKQHALWSCSPMKMKISGVRPFIGRPDLFIQVGSNKFLNTYYTPHWGNGQYDDAEVERFQAYVNYLIPGEEEYVYFLHWLAAKIQNPEFRGAAIVMVAELQGTGRSTLGDMVSTLMGKSNVANIRFDKLLRPSEFNEWAAKSLVISNETLATSKDMPQYEMAYEALKEYVDTGSKEVEINPKFGQKYMHNMTSSFLMFSNHRNALSLPAEDRRVYVIQNVLAPESPEFFISHNEWLKVKDIDGLPRWARHVYRWLMDIEVDLAMLNAPPKLTVAKAEMQSESGTGLDLLVAGVGEISEEPVIRTKDWEDIIRPFIHRVSSVPTEDAMHIIRRLLVAESKPFTDSRAISTAVGGERVLGRPRLLKKGIREGSVWTARSGRKTLTETMRKELAGYFEFIHENRDVYTAKMDEYLNIRGL